MEATATKETSAMKTADDFTIYVDVEQDLMMGGDINWTRLDDAYDEDIDALLDDGTSINVDDVDLAKTTLATLVFGRLEAAAEKRGWDLAKYDPMTADSEARTIHQMGEDGDVIAETLVNRLATLWDDIEDPTGAEIAAAL